ncbi:MAG: helix-turn-helix domain-containing protein [Terriglobia bacterium]|nr:MAG: helix-turn-helix domain-containing protein [Terriglobia bacterium]
MGAMPGDSGRRDRIIQEKWGAALDAGFQVVPNVLIRAQSRLGLDALDVVVLLNLTAHWWEKDVPPFISAARIAKRMNVTKRTVERHLKKLEEKEFIKRSRTARPEDGPVARNYDLTPLVRVLKEASRNTLTLRDRSAQKKLQTV